MLVGDLVKAVEKLLYMHATLTHHNVDQFQGLDDLKPQDHAMDAFRRFFPVVVRTIVVSDDGMEMRYRLRGTKLMDNYLKMARLIIVMHRLPLEAKQDRFAIGDVEFENDLVITFSR